MKYLSVHFTTWRRKSPVIGQKFGGQGYSGRASPPSHGAQVWVHSLVMKYPQGIKSLGKDSLILLFLDFPGGAVVKNPPANAGDTGSIPGPGRSHMPRSN